LLSGTSIIYPSVTCSARKWMDSRVIAN